MFPKILAVSTKWPERFRGCKYQVVNMQARLGRGDHNAMLQNKCIVVYQMEDFRVRFNIGRHGDWGEGVVVCPHCGKCF